MHPAFGLKTNLTLAQILGSCHGNTTVTFTINGTIKMINNSLRFQHKRFVGVLLIKTFT